MTDQKLKTQTLFVLVKPDGYPYAEEIKGKLLDKLSKYGVTSCLLEQDIKMTEDDVKKHYQKDDIWKDKYGRKICAKRLGISEKNIPVWDALHYGNTIIESIVEYMANKKMRVLVFQVKAEKNIFEVARDLLGNTEPGVAEDETIRALYSDDSFEEAWTDEIGPRAISNVCHISENELEAWREVRALLGEEPARQFFSHMFPACEQAKVEALRLVAQRKDVTDLVSAVASGKISPH